MYHYTIVVHVNHCGIVMKNDNTIRDATSSVDLEVRLSTAEEDLKNIVIKIEDSNQERIKELLGDENISKKFLK